MDDQQKTSDKRKAPEPNDSLDCLNESSLIEEAPLKRPRRDDPTPAGQEELGIVDIVVRGEGSSNAAEDLNVISHVEVDVATKLDVVDAADEEGAGLGLAEGIIISNSDINLEESEVG